MNDKQALQDWNRCPAMKIPDFVEKSNRSIEE
jgi:hypothetical protein